MVTRKRKVEYHCSNASALGDKLRLAISCPDLMTSPVTVVPCYSLSSSVCSVIAKHFVLDYDFLRGTVFFLAGHTYHRCRSQEIADF